MTPRTRLTLPMRFRSERLALNLIRDNGLFSIGAQVVALDDSGKQWRIVIDTAKPEAVCRYLAQSSTPGIEWARSELR